MTQASKRTHRLAVAAMLSAVAAVLQFVEFSIPLIPSFVKLDISDLPALLGTFSLGPVYGVVIQLVKNLLHLPFGSSAGVGELSNFILGAVFVLCAGLVYRKHKSRKGALIGAMLGAVLMAVVRSPPTTSSCIRHMSRCTGCPWRPSSGPTRPFWVPLRRSPPPTLCSTACWCSTCPSPSARACWTWACAS